MTFTLPFGLLLIFWLPRWSQSVEETVDIDTLARIINFFERNYKKVDRNGNPCQYATAINVPKYQCQAGFTNLQREFLLQENANNVKNAINDKFSALYNGTQLIAAGPKKRKGYNIHSESLLLNPANNSPMKNLLERNEQNCSIFYTFNSPCVDTCLNETKENYNILRALDNWREYSGVKAFVFKDIWKFDLQKPLQDKFKLIASRVPLYRCVSETVCYACGGEGNAPINDQCLPPPNNRGMNYRF